jgi:hypothetical protein
MLYDDDIVTRPFRASYTYIFPERSSLTESLSIIFIMTHKIVNYSLHCIAENSNTVELANSNPS